MIGSDFVTTFYPPTVRQELGKVPHSVMVGRARVIFAMFGRRWPSEN